SPYIMKRLFWLDLEMTGLNDSVDQILEVAAVITDLDFTPLEELHRVVYQTPQVLQNMNDWCKKTHGESGLTAEIPNGVPLEKVEAEVLELINRNFAPQDRIILAGNSIGNDRRFVDRYMPKMAERLHYRMVDVSSFKEIYREKYGLSFQKKNAHRAVGDIYESIRELSFYLSFVKIPENVNATPPVAKDKNL
ncbi:MAG: oligoribonuclease, partial [Bdellovibrionia bacterium]